METLVINIPDKKSTLVKQILKSLGVTIKSENPVRGKPSAHDFIGLISKKDITLMEKAINEGCEQIHADDWK